MNVLIDGVEYEPVRKPLAYVEGKPVFVGDELYYTGASARKVIAQKTHDVYLVVTDGGWLKPQECSWNPPKPHTVMVELLREDAEHYSRFAMIGQREERFKSACKKALETK